MVQICNLDKLAFEAKNKLENKEYIPWSEGCKEAVVCKNGWTVRLVEKPIGYYLSFESSNIFYENTTYQNDEVALRNFIVETAEEAVEEAVEAARISSYERYDGRFS